MTTLSDTVLHAQIGLRYRVFVFQVAFLLGDAAGAPLDISIEHSLQFAFLFFSLKVTCKIHPDHCHFMLSVRLVCTT